MLETDRLLIRDFVAEDVAVVHTLVQEPDIYKHQIWGPNTEENTKNFINMCLFQQKETPRLSFEMAITEKKSTQLIGAIGIRVKCTISKKADLGYWIRKDYWGQGFATEATKRILFFGFEQLKMNRIWATAAPQNFASLKVLEKSGMKKEGHLRSDMFARGEYRDSILFAILRGDLASEIKNYKASCGNADHQGV